MRAASRLIALGDQRNNMRRLLFARGELGVILNPGDFGALFQNSTLATPVTAFEQLVGGVVDASGTGSSTVQATAGSRPLVSAKVNTLLSAEDYSAADWGKAAVSVSANTTAAPDGSTTADTITADGTTGAHYVGQASAAVAGGKTIPFYAKAGTNNFVQLYFDADAGPWANFDLSTGTPGSKGTGTTSSWVDVGGGWWRCIVTVTSSTASNARISIVTSNVVTRFDSNTLTTSVILWGAQAEARLFATRYQRTDASTYDTVNFLRYIEYAGGKSLVTTFPADLGTNATVATAYPGLGSTILAGQTVGTTYTHNANHGYRIIVNRALTATELRYVTDYLNRLAVA